MRNVFRQKAAFLCIALGLALATLSISAETVAVENAVIGIFGDVHGDAEEARKVFDRLKARGVTHIIGTGDFVRFGGTLSLERILSMMTTITRVPPERIFLVPGNWEAHSRFSQRTFLADGFEREDISKTTFGKHAMNRVLERYGQLVTPFDHGYGVVRVGNLAIMLSHFPQIPVPEELLPPPEIRNKKKPAGQASLSETMARGVRPADVDLMVVGHTHMGGLFKDQATGTLVLNPGPLDASTKAEQVPRSFAIVLGDERKVQLLDADTGAILRASELGVRTCRGLWRHLKRNR